MANLKEYLNSDEEQGMRESFETRAEEILENEEKFEKNHGEVKVGLETEYPTVLENSFTPTPAEIRNEVIRDFDFADKEVGANHIETRTEPVMLDSLSQLYNQLDFREKMMATRAAKHNVELLRNGTNPFVDLEDIEKTDKEKYEIVPEFHEEMRNENVPNTFGIIETINPLNADIAGMINSAQTNIEAKDFDDAVSKANHTYMISPYMVALTTNSRFIDGKDTGIKDTRVPLWEKSHDIRPEEDDILDSLPAGKITSYFDNLNDYFERVSQQPFIMREEEAALDIGIGTYWKDTRIKFNEELNDIIVESRAISTQPTPEEEVAVHGFYTGRLLYAEQNNENLLDIEKVNKNRYSAMHNGLETKLYGSDGELKNAETVLENEIDKAIQGLEEAGIEHSYPQDDYDSFLDILYERLEVGTPADNMADEFYESLDSNIASEEAIMEGIKESSTIR